MLFEEFQTRICYCHNFANVYLFLIHHIVLVEGITVIYILESHSENSQFPELKRMRLLATIIVNTNIHVVFP